MAPTAADAGFSACANEPRPERPPARLDLLAIFETDQENKGLEGEYGIYAHIGDQTWQRLLEYKRGGRVKERYREMYPDVDASRLNLTLINSPAG